MRVLRSGAGILAVFLVAGCGGTDDAVFAPFFSSFTPSQIVTAPPAPVVLGRASVSSSGAQAANGCSPGYRWVSVSDDGRFTVFVSASNDLDPDDTDTLNDIYVRDRQTGIVKWVSRGASNTGVKGESTYPTISGNGRFVAFASTSSNLDPDDTDATSDVFVRDLVTSTTTLVSRASGTAGAKGNGFSYIPSISRDGSVIAFSSAASNLNPADTDNVRDIFLRNWSNANPTTTLASVSSAGVKGNGESFDPSIASDGTRVAFISLANNLDPAETDAMGDVFVRDLTSSSTVWASRGSSNTGTKGESFEPALAGNGNYVTFFSTSSNLDPDDTDAIADIFVRSLEKNTTTWVSRGSSNTGTKSTSFNPAISADGTQVLFHSSSSNLNPADTDNIPDIYIRNWQDASPTTRLLSVSAGGVKGNNQSLYPAISNDKRVIAFISLADNLVANDTNATWDVFLTGNPFTP